MPSKIAAAAVTLTTILALVMLYQPFLISATSAQDRLSSTSLQNDKPSTNAQLTLKHIFRAGFKPTSSASSHDGSHNNKGNGNDAASFDVPFLERLDLPNPSSVEAQSMTWMLDANFNLEADAGIRTPFRKRQVSPGPLPYGHSFEVSWKESKTTAPNRKFKHTAQQPIYVNEAEDTEVPHDMVHKDVVVPDHRDNKTVLALAKMAFNAYFEPNSKDWVEVPGWENSDGFGSSGAAIRGHIFTSQNSEIVAVVIKGTSLQTPFTGGPTSANDKLNDNKMFSCCCGKAGWSWTPVCKCANSAATTCNTICVERESDFRESYYRLATSIAHTVQQMFPRSAVWMTGHSLGGALAALTALTFDLPAFTYESPGDLQFAKRLGLLPPAIPKRNNTALGLDDWAPYLETLPIYQFGNDGDPVFLGTCRSVTSSCWFGGYALETKCHIGKECVYDQDLDGKKREPEKGIPRPPGESSKDRSHTLKSQSIYDHGIQYVIDRYLAQWEYVPECRVNSQNPGCNDCDTWQFT